MESIDLFYKERKKNFFIVEPIAKVKKIKEKQEQG